MRHLIAIEFVTLDGVVQAPGGPDEDTSGGFAHGGWIRPYADAVQSAVIRRQMSLPFDLLLGRRTFEIWAPYWPRHADVWPEVQAATKYVASNTLASHAWGP
jgi:dihydrofolate reductase